MKNLAFVLVLVTSLVFVSDSLASKPTFGAGLDMPSLSVGAMVTIASGHLAEVDAIFFWGRRRRRGTWCPGGGCGR